MTFPINCNNDTCPENHRCGRFMAEPKENQVYERFQWRYAQDKSNSGWTRTKKMVFGCAHFLSLPSKVLNEKID